MRKTLGIVLAVFAVFGGSRTAQAQWAVIDVGAITQLIQQVQQMEQALQLAQSQLTQAQQTYQSMTGGRGMDLLLSGINRNYLPASWPQVSVSLAGSLQSRISSNAVLTSAQWGALSPAEQQQLTAARTNASLLQVASQQAYATTSSRFASVQQLISAIPGASDQKGILDLQARISAEQGMLQNDQTKLQLLRQLVEAQELERRQRTKEQAIADVGSVRSLPPIGLLR